jgi:ammonia channel protein AmtB
VAAAAGLVTWVAIDAVRGRISIAGACVGPVVGLVAITPACGFVQPGWAILIGVIPTCIIYALLLLKKYMRFDDTLDVAVVHGIGTSQLLIFFTIVRKLFFLYRRYLRCIYDWSIFSAIAQRSGRCRWCFLWTTNSTMVSNCWNSDCYR